MLVTVKTESGHIFSFKSEKGKTIFIDKNGEVVEGLKIVMGEPMKFKYNHIRRGETLLERISMMQTAPVEEIEIS